ncbi:hypothetical protein SBY92_000894 [Candida maltosa Xu316]|uniref:Uncharacterized protein n=1 Tax=Candida maltosa (strain Xu316) TaxID=1245528 RepID=M3J305_CANMX|nr:hypothetical protein G210_3487 [Candida maltosa Xu316]
MIIIHHLFILFVTSTASFISTSEEILPQLLSFSNFESLQPNLVNIFNNNDTSQIIFHLSDSNTYLIPDDEDISLDSNNIPTNWIQFYMKNITTEIDPKGIVVMIHETVDHPYALGEIAYTWSTLKKLTLEYDVTQSVYVGFYYILSLLAGGRLSPEFDLTSSVSMMYSCSVNPGKTVMLKIYPTYVRLNPYYKKIQWNELAQKFVFKNAFIKHERVRLLALTGLEDVECLYV